MPPLPLLVTVLLVAGPGLGAALAVFGPGRIGIATRLALTFALGYLVTGGIAFALAVAQVLSPTSFFVVLAGATAGLWFVALRRGRAALHVRAVVREVAADPWPILLGLLVLGGVAVVALGFSPFLNIGPQSSWRYWADAKEIADAGRVPAASLQYGMLLPPTVSKAFLNAFDAGTIYAVGMNPFDSLGTLAWVVAVGVVASLWSAAWELGLRYTAVAFPLLAVVNRVVLYKEPSADLHTFKAESVGRMVVFAGVALGVRAFRDRLSWREAVLAGALFGAASGTHLVPVTVGLAVLAWYLVARLILDRGRVALLKQAAVTIGVAGMVAGVILLLPRGDIGFQGPVGVQDYSGFGRNFDPTRYLSGGKIDQAPHEYAGPFYIAPSRISRAFTTRGTGINPADRLGRRVAVPLEYLLLVGGLLTAVAVLLWFPRELRPMGLVAWGLGVSLVAGGLYFSFRYDLFILSQFGIRRLFDYSAFPIILVTLTLVEGGLLWLHRVRGRATAMATSVVLGLVAAVILIPTARVPRQNVPKDLARLESLQWIRTHTPCDARVLLSQRTTGIIQVLTGRVGVAEGMAPYLRPDILKPVVELLLDARGFLERPADNQAVLTERGIDYVVVLRETVLGFRSPLGKPDLAALAGLPSLKRVYSSTHAEIFEVTVAGSVSTFPDPARYPAYRCRHGAILEAAA